MIDVITHGKDFEAVIVEFFVIIRHHHSEYNQHMIFFHTKSYIFAVVMVANDSASNHLAK